MQARLISVLGALVLAGPAVGAPVNGLNLSPNYAIESRLPYLHASLLWSAPMQLLPRAACANAAGATLKTCRGGKKTQDLSRRAGFSRSFPSHFRQDKGLAASP